MLFRVVALADCTYRAYWSVFLHPETVSAAACFCCSVCTLYAVLRSRAVVIVVVVAVVAFV